MGEIPVGGFKTVHFYVKNLGETTMSLSLRGVPDYSVGSISWGINPQTKAPSEVSDIHIDFSANPNAEPGTYSFTFYIDAAA